MKDFILRNSSLYNKWTEEEQLNWKQHQKDGLAKFIFFQGFLKWGLISLVIFLLASHSAITAKAENPLLHIVETCFVWILASFAYGYLMWIATQKSYHKKFRDKSM